MSLFESFNSSIKIPLAFASLLCFATTTPLWGSEKPCEVQTIQVRPISEQSEMPIAPIAYIENSTHIRNLAVVCVFGSCIDLIASCRSACFDAFLCCPIKFGISLVLDPICASYWCCTLDSTPPRMRKSLNHLVTKCSGQVFWHSRSRVGSCCPSEQVKELIQNEKDQDARELGEFKAWRQQKMI
jgi:hypothetical protein